MSPAFPFTTIPELFVGATDFYAPHARTALAHSTRAGETALTHSALRARVDAFACGLAALGIARGDRIGIVAENRPEWVIADHAVLTLGAVDVPVFPSLTAEQLRWIFANAETIAVIVSNELQLKKILSVADAVPSLRHIVIMSAPGAGADARVIPFNDILARGGEAMRARANELAVRRATVTPDDLATIIYTSGTTGEPKGVMLTHGNLVANIKAALAAMPRIDESDVILSYLPLCHSFERIAHYFMFAAGTRSVLAESIDRVAENLRAVRPTIVTTVPRLLERMYAKIQKRMDAGPSRQRAIFLRAVDIGLAYHRAQRAGRVNPLLALKFRAARWLVFEKLQALIGGRLRFFVSGGAALPKDLGEWFEAIGIIVLEGDGMTECSPVISVNRFGEQCFGTVGPPLPGLEVHVASDGELLVRGPSVMHGYWRNDAATRESIDAEGWLHTGDVGELDEKGRIKITDRKKHLFVSSGGKNIAPQAIENELLQSLYIDQIFLIGDKRPFVAALIVPDFDALRAAAAERAPGIFDPSALVAHPAILSLFQQELDRLQQHLANYERVRRFTLLATPFTIESGELTPTQKLKRKIVEERFAAVIEKMYL